MTYSDYDIKQLASVLRLVTRYPGLTTRQLSFRWRMRLGIKTMRRNLMRLRRDRRIHNGKSVICRFTASRVLTWYDSGLNATKWLGCKGGDMRNPRNWSHGVPLPGDGALFTP